MEWIAEADCERGGGGGGGGGWHWQAADFTFIPEMHMRDKASTATEGKEGRRRRSRFSELRNPRAISPVEDDDGFPPSLACSSGSNLAGASAA